MWWRAARARRRIAGARAASTSAAAAGEKSCRAVVVPRFGGPEVLEVRQGVPVPDLKPGDVLVRARAVSINPLDLRVSALLWTPSPWELSGEMITFFIIIFDMSGRKIGTGARFGSIFAL